jgi:phosphatidylserine/phosphatidylglycerophosphate/cardiolipin synthase-like enzyme
LRKALAEAQSRANASQIDAEQQSSLRQLESSELADLKMNLTAPGEQEVHDRMSEYRRARDAAVFDEQEAQARMQVELAHALRMARDDGTRVLRDGTAIQEWVEAIAQARKKITIVAYTATHIELAGAICTARARGVRIWVMIDF